VGHRRGRPRSEVIEQYYRRRAALAASCAGFDRGDEFEVERIATEVFTLVHDGGSIVSVLTQLGIRGNTRFISSGSVDPASKNLLASIPLVMTRIDSANKIAVNLPKLGAGSPQTSVQFPTWWEKELIYKDGSFTLKRRNLVFSLRHQDGGGHVGQLTDVAYKRLKLNPMFMAQFGNDPAREVTGAVGATMRQVGWELEHTLDKIGELK
jgi:hypothetical protein